MLPSSPFDLLNQRSILERRSGRRVREDGRFRLGTEEVSGDISGLALPMGEPWLEDIDRVIRRMVGGYL